MAGGVDKIPYMTYMCVRQINNVRVLFDNDDQAIGVKRTLLKSNIVKETQLVMVSEQKGCTIEDLVDRKLFLRITKEIYPAVTIKDDGKTPILEVLKKSFRKDISEQKMKIADRLIEQLPNLKGQLGDTINNFSGLISKINATVASTD